MIIMPVWNMTVWIENRGMRKKYLKYINICYLLMSIFYNIDENWFVWEVLQNYLE